MRKDQDHTVDTSVRDNPMPGSLQDPLFPEFGSFRDNLSAFEIALYHIEQGQEETSFKILYALHKHLTQKGDLKSIIWLKGPLESLLHLESLLGTG